MKDYAKLLAALWWPFDVSKDQRFNTRQASQRRRCARDLREKYPQSLLQVMWHADVDRAKEPSDAT